MLRAVLQDVEQGLPVGKAEHVIEVLLRVFGVASRVRSSENGNRPPCAEEVTEGISGVGGFGEGADEQQVESIRQLFEQIFKAGIADQGDVVPQLPAPNANHLRHDAGQVGIHDASV